MMQEIVTTLPGGEVLLRAKTFFAERVPQYSAFLEKEGPGYAVFRGQGGEEIAVAWFEEGENVKVRASSMLHEQVIGRFLSTLPAAEAGAE
ncbi:MAG: hypothetical protein JSW51_08285 [Gemmatimonadota bacterium]|nr:MAG: hypothetical protein JSW51_08285 [Gemmatimonadota bacterium]